MRWSWNSPGWISPSQPHYSILVLINVLVTTFLAILSGVITIISDQAIQGELGLGETKAVWLTTIYLLGVNTVVPTSSWFGGRFGNKTMYAFGVFTFSMASILAACSTNFAMMASARLIEGIGAGFIFPIGLTMIVQTLPPKRLSLGLILYIGASFGAGFALGFPIAGYLTEFASWRTVFALIAPLSCLGGIACALIHHQNPREVFEKLDGWGFFFFASFIASLLIALTYGPLNSTDEGWRSPYIIALFAIALFCLVMTLWIEKHHPNPLIPLKLFHNPVFAVATIAMFVLGMAIFTSASTMMRYMIDALGYDRWQSGLLGASYGLTLFGGSILGNFLIKKFPVVCMTFLGLAILVISYILNNELDWQTGPKQIVSILLLRGAGIGLALGPTTLQAMQNVPKELSAKGATLLTFFRQVGGTYGGTLLSIVIIKRQVFHTARFSEPVSAQIPGYQVTFRKLFDEFYANTSEGKYDSLRQAKGAILRNILDQSLIQSINDAVLMLAYVTGGIAIMLLVLSIFPPKTKSTETF